MHVTIVDGNPDTQSLFRHLLRDMGHDVTNCYNGLDALQSSCDRVKNSPDLVLLEILPFQATARETMRKLRSLPSWGRVPVILTTTLKIQDTITSGREVGAAGILVKPFDISTFQSCITSSIQNWVNLSIERARAPEGST